MITFDTMYRARTPIKMLGSSNGIFFETCIIPRMTTRLVLDDVSYTSLGKEAAPTSEG